MTLKRRLPQHLDPLCAHVASDVRVRLARWLGLRLYGDETLIHPDQLTVTRMHNSSTPTEGGDAPWRATKRYSSRPTQTAEVTYRSV